MRDTTSTRLKKLLAERDLRQVDVLEKARPYCEEYGVKLSKSDLSQYVTGKVLPGQDKLTILGLALNVSEAWLMGYDVPMERDAPSSSPFCSQSLPDNIIPLPKPHYIPLVGTIACGEPLLAEENLDGVVPIPEYIHADFGLRCKGDSMVGARILDGDIVCIRQQPDVEDGEIAAVLIDGEATLKRVYKIPGRLQLRPENPSFPVLEYTGPELEQVRILGKAVYFISPVK